MNLTVPALLASTALVSAFVPLGHAANARPGVTERISVSSDGVQANAASNEDVYSHPGPAMTPNGRFVVFTSKASNLVSGDTNGEPTATGMAGPGEDVFVRDRLVNTTERVSVTWNGSQGSVYPTDVLAYGRCSGSDHPAISADGQYVAFRSCDDNLIPGQPPVSGDTNQTQDIFVRDRLARTTTRVSVDSNGKQANGSSDFPLLSADGRYVVFTSRATNLVSQPSSACPAALVCPLSGTGGAPPTQIYLHDRITGTTKAVSVAANGELGNGDSSGVSISPDGRFVSFMSLATNLAPPSQTMGCEPPARPCADLYVRDLRSAQTTLFSVDSDGRSRGSKGDGGTGGAGANVVPQGFSADNRYMLFFATAAYVPSTRTRTASVLETVYGQAGLYVVDRKTTRVVRVSVDSDGMGVRVITGAAISTDGRYVAFIRMADDLSSGCGWEVVGVHDRVTGSTEYVGEDCPATQGSNAAQPVLAPAISADGRYVAFSALASRLVPGDTNSAWDVFVRDRGTPLGVGGLLRGGKLALVGGRSFSSTGIESVADPATDSTQDLLTNSGADIIGATLAYRPRQADLFIRLDVQRMPSLAAANPALIYGVNLQAGGVRYQVRVAKMGLDASFALFRLDRGVWTKTGILRGGYGTTGQEVVIALPLSELRLQDGGRLSQVTGFAARGSSDAGPIQVLDRITLSKDGA